MKNIFYVDAPTLDSWAFFYINIKFVYFLSTVLVSIVDIEDEETIWIYFLLTHTNCMLKNNGNKFTKHISSVKASIANFTIRLFVTFDYYF